MLLPLGYRGQSLWLDEGSSVWLARLPLITLLTSLCDPHPAGYYLLLKVWLNLGQSEVWLRLPSLVAGLLAVALTWRWGRELAGEPAGRLGALLLASHPSQVWYAAEVRMYTLAQAAGLGLVWSGYRLLHELAGAPRRSFGPAAIYTGLLAGTLGLDYSVLLPWGLLQLLWLGQGRPRPTRWLSLQAAGLTGAAALWLQSEQLTALQHGYIPILIAGQAVRLGLALTPELAGRLLLAGLGAGLLLLTAGVWGWSHGLGRHWSPRLGAALILTLWGLTLLLGVSGRGLTIQRQLVVLLPYLALLSAAVLARPGSVRALIVAGCGLLLTLCSLSTAAREPWRATVAELHQQLEPGAVVWVDELAVPVVAYYWPDPTGEAQPAPWQPLHGRALPALPDRAPEPGRGLWLVTPETTYRRLTALLPEQFWRDYRLLEARQRPGLALYHYRRRHESLGGPLQRRPPSPAEAWGLQFPSPLSCEIPPNSTS